MQVNKSLSSRPLPMVVFAAVALTPAVLLAMGVASPVWLGLGLIYMTVLVLGMDLLTARFQGDAPEGAEFPGNDALLAVIGVTALVALPVAARVLSGDLGWGWKIAGFLALGFWLGQVAVPAAHELIHRPGRGLFWLGAAVYTALLFGHHTSAHRLVHHRFAATPDDPNSARPGEGYYRFALRAWVGSFRQGLRMESARRQGQGLHPYVIYCGGAVAALVLANAIAGWGGVLVWAGLSLHATSQLLLSDYVQHYGLARAIMPTGKPEPMALRHSWNAPHWFSSALMLNAPRHSDHHAHPARPYPALRLPAPDVAPQLPWPLPLACMIALMPKVWRRAIRPHLKAWQVNG